MNLLPEQFKTHHAVRNKNIQFKIKRQKSKFETRRVFAGRNNFSIGRVIFLSLQKHNGKNLHPIKSLHGHGAHIIRTVVINLMAKVARWKTFQIKANPASCPSLYSSRLAALVGNRPRKTLFLSSINIQFH